MALGEAATKRTKFGSSVYKIIATFFYYADGIIHIYVKICMAEVLNLAVADGSKP